MATLDKEIKVIAVKGMKGDNGQDGKSSYELAVEELHYSGTLEEWLESFATPENYVTRNEFKKVTQAEYDALEQAQELIPDCYYIITDDTTYDDLITRLNGIDTTILEIQNDITSKYNSRIHTRELIQTEAPENEDEIYLDGVPNPNNYIEITGYVRKNDTTGFKIYFSHKIKWYSTTEAYTLIGQSIVNTSPVLGRSVIVSTTFDKEEVKLTIDFRLADNGGLINNPTQYFSYKIVSVKELINY